MTAATAPSEQVDFDLRSLIASVYLPTFLFSVGQGAVIPAVPLLAVHLGASTAFASLVVGMRGIGTMAMDVPGGVLESRLGDKFVMVTGTALVAVVALGASFSSSPLQLALLMLVMGSGWAFWQLARLAFVSEIVPSHQRGRVLSMVGGTNRIGNFVGPLIGGFVGARFGLNAIFYVQAAVGISAALVMVFSVNEANRTRVEQHTGVFKTFGATLSAHRRVFATAGFAVVMLQLLRQARQVFLPLWGKSIGLDIEDISIVFSISTAIDMFMFYPAGQVMDRWGRKWVAVPSLLILSLSVALIPLSHGFGLLALIGLLAGFGNGIGAGIAMTLGADFAPSETRGEFLGLWRFVGDMGTAGGPLLIGFLAGVASLGAASVTVAAFGLAGAVLLSKVVPEPLKRSPPEVATVP
ncbi:MAG TPA: MFS transporter [Dehalococcoidia bacterium]